jgi:hypothetical protein
MNKVKLGFFSFTEITDPNEHHAYNEWHMLDHMPEQYPLRGVAGGERWVSTPACRAARTASDALLDPIHYATCYLMTDPVDETLSDFMELGAKLHELGRFHAARQSLLSGPFQFLDAHAAPRVRVSPESLPWRPKRGVWITVDDVIDRAPLDAHIERIQTEITPAALAVPGVAGVWQFASSRRMFGTRWSTGDRRISIWYLDDDPIETGRALAPIIDVATPALHRLFSGPLETVRVNEWDWFDA